MYRLNLDERIAFEDFKARVDSAYLESIVSSKSKVLTDYALIYEDRPFIQLKSDRLHEPKGNIWDFDGVLPKPGTKDMYKLIFEHLGLDKLIGIYVKKAGEGDIVAAESGIRKIFIDSHITWEDYYNGITEAVGELVYARNTEKCMHEMVKAGYMHSFNSGSLKLGLLMAGGKIGVKREHVYGSPDPFEYEIDDEGRMTTDGILKPEIFHLNLGPRKAESKKHFMEDVIGSRHAWHIVFADNLTFNGHMVPIGPMMSGVICPSVWLMNYKRLEIPFDFAIACLEARDDMMLAFDILMKIEKAFMIMISKDPRERLRQELKKREFANDFELLQKANETNYPILFETCVQDVIDLTYLLRPFFPEKLTNLDTYIGLSKHLGRRDMESGMFYLGKCNDELRRYEDFDMSQERLDFFNDVDEQWAFRFPGRNWKLGVSLDEIMKKYPVISRV